MRNLLNILLRIKNSQCNTHISDISQLQVSSPPQDIFILGNGSSLNSITPKDLEGKYTIGTNRSWLWGKTDILIWRDGRITEELDFFGVEKNDSIWIAGTRAFENGKVNLSDSTRESIDYTFTDEWKKTILGDKIKWNGIIFHAIAVAKYISPDAMIHLIGVDLTTSPNYHHFFNKFQGFNQGFYKHHWEPESFNYKKRLDMMLQNFSLLKMRGFKFINHSPNSRLTELFGHKPVV
jgi:hypothetical protein